MSKKSREFMPAGRYEHWFWNSKFIGCLSRVSSRFNNWLWYMQYGRPGAKGT